ncbi:hypothetical protein VNO80_11781 [Phaseolus coccineus]|uniref:Uncharacterized protein n=1 Tax=Phaseolus coccineus TaxID=3886 RepID=A0AAN9RKS1_PHACN
MNRSRLFISNSKRVTTQHEETRRLIVQQLNQLFCFSSLPSASTYFRPCKQQRVEGALGFILILLLTPRMNLIRSSKTTFFNHGPGRAGYFSQIHHRIVRVTFDLAHTNILSLLVKKGVSYSF